MSPSRAGEDLFSKHIHTNNGTSGENDDNKFRFVVLSKNARINSNERIVQVLAELETVEWDVVLFSETRAAQSKVTLDGGHVLHTNITGNPYAGVGICYTQSM